MTNKIICSWDNSFGKISGFGVHDIIKNKPNLSFPFESFHYNEEFNIYFKFIKNERFDLTEDEKNEILEYAKYLIMSSDDVVLTFFEKNTGIFRGFEIKKNYKLDPDIYNYTIFEQPDVPISKWNGVKWIPIKALIRDDGSLIVDPTSICHRCVLFFDEDEYELMEKPKNEHQKYDFVTETWIDKRNIQETKQEYITLIRTLFEQYRWKKFKKLIPQYELATWPIQYNEAFNYLKDKTFDTPFIDTYIKYYNITKDKNEMCQEIINNNKFFAEMMGEIHALEWNSFNKINQCESLDQIDNEYKKILKQYSDI